ncbi:MAG TPA: hypothetical protein VKM94_26870 [Blastocatellia bacterium]|nr:hypothetical protein [Blastocatellia bacterium]
MEGTGLPNIQSRKVQEPTVRTGDYLPLMTGQTVCTVKNEKGENCQGHVKQWSTAPADVAAKAAPGNTLHRCQRCFAIYEGPPQEYLHPTKKTK